MCSATIGSSQLGSSTWRSAESASASAVAPAHTARLRRRRSTPARAIAVFLSDARSSASGVRHKSPIDRPSKAARGSQGLPVASGDAGVAFQGQTSWQMSQP
jgi:hypothetical protein